MASLRKALLPEIARVEAESSSSAARIFGSTDFQGVVRQQAARRR